MDAALAFAPRLAPAAIDAMETAFARMGPRLPMLAQMVAGNMRAAGLYSRQVHRDYFACSAAHLAGVLHVLRYAGRGSTGQVHPALSRLVEERVRLDDSFSCLSEAAAGGKGVVLLGVHAANYMLVLARINQELPITVYLRYSPDPRKQAAKTAWCRAAGLEFIAEPPGVLDPSHRAELMARALQEGRILIVTPDLAQKREEGVPVRFLDREIYLPGGPVALSLIVEAPLVTVVAAPGAPTKAITLRFFGPKSPKVVDRRRGWRQEATHERLQWFTDLFTSEFLCRCPALWFLWGDKRWTRAFRGDPRYTSPLPEAGRER